jgi:hypothetical protein
MINVIGSFARGRYTVNLYSWSELTLSFFKGFHGLSIAPTRFWLGKEVTSAGSYTFVRRVSTTGSHWESVGYYLLRKYALAILDFLHG